MEKIIPLFPLSLVVFPNSYYPLHIIEDRYKSMIVNCQKYELPFAVVAVLEGKIVPVGTTVQVVKVIGQFDDSTFNVVVKGKERVKIARSWKHSAGYDEALIEVVPDSAIEADIVLVDELEKRFKELLGKVNVKLEESFWLNLSFSPTKSFKVAEKSGISLNQQIELLSLTTEEGRILYLLDHFMSIERYLSNQEVISSLILNDGYINTK